MGLIPGFENDIFISYAHADNLNGPAGGDENGWVVSFARMLRETLKDTLKPELKKHDNKLKIYWDNQIAKGEPIDWQLNAEVENSAIFLMFMSDHYLDSDYCRKEVEWFLEVIEKRRSEVSNSVSHLWPILVVSLGPTNKNLWPPNQLLLNSKPFDFFDMERHNRDPRYAYPSVEITKDQDFYKEFNNLQASLTAKIKRVIAGEENKEIPEKPHENNADAIEPYHSPDVVVVSTEDMVRKSHRLVNMCTAEKLSPLVIDSKMEVNLAKSSIENSIANAKALILLLGVYPGDEAESISALLEYSCELAKKNNIKVIPWMLPGRTIELVDDDFDDYLDFLKNIQGEIKNFEFVEFAGEIKQLCGSSEQPKRFDKTKLFIDAAKVDHSLAIELKGIIDSKNLNIRTFVPVEGADQQAHNEEWNKVVGRCDGVMLIYGAVDIDAIDDKLDQVERLAAKRKSESGAEISIAILDAPPSSSYDLSSPNVDMISVDQSLDAEKIVTFLHTLSKN